MTSSPHSELVARAVELARWIELDSDMIAPQDAQRIRDLVEQLETLRSAAEEGLRTGYWGSLKVALSNPASVPDGGRAIRQERVTPGDASGGARVSDSPGTPSVSNQESKP